MRSLLLLAALGTAAAAQPVAVDSSCSFTHCALRIESGVFRSHVVRGPIGAEEVVADLGILGGGVRDAVAGSPAALAHAERSRSRYRAGLLLNVAAGLLYTVALTPLTDVPDGLQVGAALGGLALAVASGPVLVDAHRSRERAIWEYNRTFAD